MKELLEEILPYLDEAEEFRPVVKKVITILKSYSSELKSLFDGLAEYSVDRRIKSINRFEKAGFTREEAINLTMDEWYSIARGIRNYKRNKS